MITAYCTPCIYCRSAGAMRVCHYYLDTGDARPCAAGDGCTVRVVLPPDERAAYIADKRDLRIAKRRDRIQDDHITDSRGIVGESYKNVDLGR